MTTTATPLAGLRVADAMHTGLVTCPPDTPLRSVARMMTTYRVHAILVSGHGERLREDGAWRLLSDLDLLRVPEDADLDRQAVRDIATTPPLTVSANADLADAAHRIVAGEVSHLLVLEPQTQLPIGMLSTLDVARALAGFPERHPGG